MNSEVSVVIPAYLCRATLPECLSSIERQTCQPLEVIIVDDGSPDDLVEIVAPFLSKQPGWILHRNPANLGLSKTLNRGIRKARASLILTLHTDCILAPNYLELLLKVMAGESRVAGVTGFATYNDPATMRLPDRLFYCYNFLWEQKRPDSSELIPMPYLEGKADLWSLGALEPHGGFEENLRVAGEDHDLSYSLLKEGWKLVGVPDAGYRIIFNGTQETCWQSLKKQIQYGSGMSFVILRHGFGNFNRSRQVFPNRAGRRASHIVSTALTGIFACLSIGQPIFMAGIPLVAGLRSLQAWMKFTFLPFRSRLPVGLFAIVIDIFYTWGLVCGTVNFARMRISQRRRG
jgi:glycosyltransferase involved in cell wall biosynthesis